METRTEVIAAPSGPMGVHVVRPDGDGPFPVVVFFLLVQRRAVAGMSAGAVKG